MHSILDASGERTNPAADVSIGAHVWVGQRAMILKGAKIGDNCVVGAGAIVVGTIPANSLCVGVPAKTIRSGVSWRHDLI
jgi:acetyltransferase-like isoleucine patch superfamily enzyme